MSWPDFCAHTAFSSVAGGGIGAEFFSGYAFDKCLGAPHDQQWGQRPSKMKWRPVRLCSHHLLVVYTPALQEPQEGARSLALLLLVG